MTKISIGFWVLLLWSLCTSSSLDAQSVREDLKRLYQNFEGVETLYFEFRNRLVKGAEVGLDQKGQVYKRGGLYYYKIDQHQLLITRQYILVIDDQQKTILCNSWTKAKADQLSQQKALDLEGVLERYPTIAYQGMKEGYKQYTFENQKEALYKVDVYFNPSTGFIQKAIYHYHPSLEAAGAELQVSLPVIDTDPSFPKGIFSAQQFIVERQGQLFPSSRYAQYTVHDLRRSTLK